MNNLGIYYPTNSFWHNLDPRSTMIVVLSVTVLLWFTRGYALIGAALLVLLLFITAKLPLRLTLELLHKFKWFLVITFLANSFFSVTRDSFNSGFFENSLRAFTITGRLAAMLLIAMWMSLVTRPVMVIEAFKRLLKPLTIFKLPIFDFALVLALVLRFIPELLAESENIITAQRIRGVRPKLTWQNSGTWIQSTVIPIFISSIRKSAAMATAMEARGFRPGAPRSAMEELTLHLRDYLVITVSLSLMLFLLIKNLV